MSDELQRLSDAASQGEWYEKRRVTADAIVDPYRPDALIAGAGGFEVLRARKPTDLAFIVALVNAYRAGGLVAAGVDPKPQDEPPDWRLHVLNRLDALLEYHQERAATATADDADGRDAHGERMRAAGVRDARSVFLASRITGSG